jgi:hypothetical protein
MYNNYSTYYWDLEQERLQELWRLQREEKRKKKES